MSVFEKLIEATYVDHDIEGKEYYFPCNRYMSYSKKLMSSGADASSKELFEYFNGLFGMFASEFPNTKDPNKPSLEAWNAYFAAFDAFNKDNGGNLFSEYEREYENSNKQKGHYSMLYTSKMRALYGKSMRHFSNCQELYKTFDKSLSCCKLCSHLKGNTTINQHESDEEKILYFVLANQQNFNMMREWLELNVDKLFKCSIDLHCACKTKEPLYPAIIPIYNAYIKAILKCDEVWSLGIFEANKKLKESIMLSVPGADQVAELLLSQLLLIISENLFNHGQPCEDRPVELAVINILGGSKEPFRIANFRPKTAPQEEPQKDIKPTEQNEEVKEDKTLNKLEPQHTTMSSIPDADDDLPFKLTEDDIVKEPEEETKKPVVAKEEQAPELVPKVQEEKKTDPADTASQVNEAEQPKQLPTSAVAKADEPHPEPNNLPAVSQPTSPSVIDAGADVKITDVPGPSFASVVKNLAEDDFIIDNTFDKIDEYALRLTDPICRMQFENTVLSDRFLAIEALKDSTGHDFLLFWGRGKKSFYYLYMDDKDELDLIKPYLTRNSYIKICYQPYHIYAFGRKYGIEIKRVFSIQTCYSFFNKGASLESYENTINSFCTIKIGAKQTKPYPMLLCGMQMYPYICTQCNRQLKESHSLSQMDEFVDFDEAIGRSYFIENLYETPGTEPAFKLEGPNTYNFPIVDRGKTLLPGRYFYFQIGEGYTELEAHRVIYGVITRLAEKGRFRKNNIYICSLENIRVRFWIPEYYVHYFETFFNSVFTDVAKEKVGKKLKLLLREEITEVVEKQGDPTLEGMFPEVAT